ncbi:hypothetical protein [Stenotrophomonas chelatiphaga]|uniref:hypothetical protein n=1 Tax=Stenotrophomonas chelatiphaga TaxID=517011 RepID=UPI00289E3F69|nr:hypothetical protein [Stenotrophomonas chelatiphaga]
MDFIVCSRSQWQFHGISPIPRVVRIKIKRQRRHARNHLMHVFLSAEETAGNTDRLAISRSTSLHSTPTCSIPGTE